MAEFDEYKADYTDQIERATRFAGKGHDFFVKVKAEYFLELLARSMPRGKPIRLLDVGCGHGAIHPVLRASGLPLQITGIDVAAEVIELAREANPGVQYDVYDGADLPYAAGTFDAALAITVMHHVPPDEWSRFLSEMTRVVRSGGSVTIFEHNPYNPLTNRVVRNCPLDKNAVLLSSSRLSRLMRGVGLEDVLTRFVLFTPFESRLFKLVDRALGRLPLGAQYFVTGRVRRASRAGPGP